jgi:hypothetical protein
LLTRTFYKRFGDFDKDFGKASAMQIGCYAAGQALPAQSAKNSFCFKDGTLNES